MSSCDSDYSPYTPSSPEYYTSSDCEEGTPIFNQNQPQFQRPKKNQSKDDDYLASINKFILIAIILLGLNQAYKFVQKGGQVSEAVKKLQKRMKALKKEMATLQTEVKEIEEKVKEVEQEKEKKVKEKEEIAMEILNIENQKAEPSQKLEKLNEEIKALEAKEHDMREDLKSKKMDLKDSKKDEYALVKKEKELIEGNVSVDVDDEYGEGE